MDRKSDYKMILNLEVSMFIMPGQDNQFRFSTVAVFSPGCCPLYPVLDYSDPSVYSGVAREGAPVTPAHHANQGGPIMQCEKCDE